MRVRHNHRQRGGRRTGSRKGVAYAKGSARWRTHFSLFKYHVACEYEALLERKRMGLISDPLQRTSDLFKGLSTSNIWNWHVQLGKLKAALVHENSGGQSNSNRHDRIVAFSSWAARKASQLLGRQCAFAAAEVELYKL